MPPLSTRVLNAQSQPRKTPTPKPASRLYGENSPLDLHSVKRSIVRPNMSAALGKRERSATPTTSTDSRLPRPSVDALSRTTSLSRSGSTRPAHFTATQASSPININVERKPLPRLPTQRAHTPTSKPLPPRPRNTVARDGSPVGRRLSVKADVRPKPEASRWVPSPQDSHPVADPPTSSAAVSPVRESEESSDGTDGNLSSSDGAKSADSRLQTHKPNDVSRATRLPRLSEIRSQTSDSSTERPHSPCPDSFSQPRPRAQHASGFANHEKATASTIALYEPKRTPDVVHIRRGSTHTLARTISARSARVPTFGARRLDDPNDFAALVQASPSKRESYVVQGPLTPMPLQQDQTSGGDSIISDSGFTRTKSPLGYKARRMSNMPVMSAFDDSTLSLGEDESGDLVPLRLDIPTMKRPDRTHVVNLHKDHMSPISSTPRYHEHKGQGLSGDTNHQETLDRLEGKLHVKRATGPSEHSHNDIAPMAARTEAVANEGWPAGLPSYAQQTTASQRRRSGGLAVVTTPIERTSGPLRMPSKASSVLGNSAGNTTTGRKRAAPDCEHDGDLATMDKRRSMTSNVEKVPQSQSRSRTVMSNIKGLFSAKRDARARPVREDGSTTKTRPFQTPRSRQGSMSGGTSLAKMAVDSGSPGVQMIAAFATQIWQETLHKNDSVEQERMFSLATVLLDALANAKQAEKAMLEAQKAAAEAKASHDLTQHSLSQIDRLLRGEDRGASLVRHLALRSSQA